MKKIIITLCLSLPLFGLSAKEQKSLKSFVEKVSKLTNTKYIMTKELKGTAGHSKNFKLTNGNADQFLSNILYQNGYTRVPLDKGDGFNIVHARDVRYIPVPQYIGSKDQQPKVPNNYDYYQLVYKIGVGKTLKGFARSVRPFLSRYGRIIDAKFGNFIIIQDSGRSLNRLYKLAKLYESTLVKNMDSKIEKMEEQNFEIRKIKAAAKQECSDESKFSKPLR